MIIGTLPSTYAREFFEKTDPRRLQTTQAIETILGVCNATIEGLPEIPISKIISVANQSLENGQEPLEARKLIPLLSKYPLSIPIQDEEYSVQLVFPDAPGLNPANVARGGLRRSTAREALIRLVPVDQVTEFSRQIDQDPTAEMVEASPKREEIMAVLNWFKEVGGKKWMTGQEQLFVERLIQLARGEEVDFLIWNCVGFDWTLNGSESYPSSTILDNSDTAITRFFEDRISEMAEQLSRLGDPNIIILLPTNEVFAETLSIWDYTQTTQEREELFQRIQAKLEESLNKLIRTNNVKIMRWDEYLKQAGAGDELKYTTQGVKRMTEDSSYSSDEKMKLAEEVCDYFRTYGIELCPTEALGESELRYYGVYAGEGIASKGNKIGSRNIVWVNFEEGNVASSQMIGADNLLAIVTPASQQETTRYYQEKRKILEKRGIRRKRGISR